MLTGLEEAARVSNPIPKKNPSLVPSSDPIYPLWDEVLKKIIDSDSINCSSVLAIDCFHYGESLECDKNPTSVLVTIKRSSKGPWKDTREAIVSILDQHNLHHIAVAISEGQIWPG